MTRTTSSDGAARLAAERGVKLVLNSRDEHDLLELTTALRTRGATVAMVVGDVAGPDAMAALAETAVRELGGFDTWVLGRGERQAGGRAPPP